MSTCDNLVQQGPLAACVMGSGLCPLASISEKASVVSGTFQQNTGVRKATGTAVFPIKSPNYYFREMGSLINKFTQCYMGKIKLLGINSLTTIQLQQGS